MTKADEINSTDKLLDLIRSPNQDEPEEMDAPVKKTPSDIKTTSFLPSITFRKRYIVGVDIGHTYIKIAKAVRLKDRSYELLDYSDIPFGAQVSFKDRSFTERLKEGLDQICEERSDCEIWSTIPSAKVETRRLRIPRLPHKQIANAVFWTFTNKVEFNENEEVLDFEILEDISEGGVKKTDVMAYKVPRAEVLELKNVFNKIGYPLKGISIVPFAIQNLFRSSIITQPEQDVCSLFIGRDWSRIAVYSKGNLVLSRGIKAGMRSMVEAINIAIHGQDDWTNNGSDPEIGRENDTESLNAIPPESQKLFFDFLHYKLKPSRTSDDGGPPSSAEVFQMILPAMERLIRQVERTFEHYVLNFQGNGVKRIYLSGQATANRMIVDHIGHQLDLPVEVMNPFSQGANFVRRVNIPETQAQRESYLPAIGLALSDNRKTPNALFTHEDKDRVESVRAFNQRVLIGCMVCLLFMIGLFSWQERQLDAKRAQINKLNYKLLSYSPTAEKQILMKLFSKTKQKRQGFEKIIRRYAPLAMINELSQVTPSNIRLIGIEGAFSDRTDKARKNSINVDGIIFADPAGFETTLTSYLLNLKNSPIFTRPALKNKRREFYDNQEVLRFTATLEVI